MPGLLNEARQLLARKKLLEAAKAYAKVIACEPHCVEALGQLGNLFFQLGQPGEALASLQRAVRLAPATPKLHLLTGAVLKSLGRFEESAACCEREIQLCPADADARYNLGLVLQCLKRPAEAVESFKQAVKLRAGYVAAWAAMGMALRQTGSHEAALECFERVIQLDPNHAESHFEAGTILLSQGHYERGWQEYEWRWKLKKAKTPIPHFVQPLWDGKDLNGRRILLHCEQGFGDTIQFSRFASLVADLHGEVILGCPEELRTIMETVRGVRQVVTSRLNHPEFDAHAPLMSLPRILGIRLENIPREMPYVKPPGPPAVTLPRIKPSMTFKVGLVWSASLENVSGRYRSLRLEILKSWLHVPGLEWYSLQCGTAANELMAPEFAGLIENLGAGIRSFGDTAHTMTELNLIITVDTAAAHLAGALGRPVWTLIPSEPDWRWMIQREDSPWYPTMRLFRQTNPHNWDNVVEQVKDALSKLI